MAKVYDNRFNGLLYLNENTTCGGFIQGEDLSKFNLSGKTDDSGVNKFQVTDAEGEAVGEGVLGPNSSKNPKAPIVVGRITIAGVTTRLAGFEQEIEGSWAIQLKPNKLAAARRPSDVYRRKA